MRPAYSINDVAVYGDCATLVREVRCSNSWSSLTISPVPPSPQPPTCCAQRAFGCCSASDESGARRRPGTAASGGGPRHRHPPPAPPRPGRRSPRYAAPGPRRLARHPRASRRSTRCCAATSPPRCARSLRCSAPRPSSRPPCHRRGRTVVDGVPLVDGRPLADTDLWAAEEGPRPGRSADALAGLDHVTVPLAVVRDPSAAAGRAGGSRGRGRVAGLRRRDRRRPRCRRRRDRRARHPLLVGSAALVAAAAAVPPDDQPDDQPDHQQASARRRASTGAGRRPSRATSWSRWSGPRRPPSPDQVALLTELGLPVLALDPARAADRAVARPATASSRRSRAPAWW